jgi:hypothetical protein
MKKLVYIGLLFGTVWITAFTTNVSYNDKGSHEIDPKVKAEIMSVLDEYMSAFNAKDLDAWESTYHFPHYRLASGDMTSLAKPGLRDSLKVFGALQKSGWHHSEWDHRNIIQASDNKVHVDTRFSRYKSDGNKLGVYESLYILTKENSQWGVKMRSSYAE